MEKVVNMKLSIFEQTSRKNNGVGSFDLVRKRRRKTNIRNILLGKLDLSLSSIMELPFLWLRCDTRSAE